jgi:hypothetical protein
MLGDIDFLNFSNSQCSTIEMSIERVLRLLTAVLWERETTFSCRISLAALKWSLSLPPHLRNPVHAQGSNSKSVLTEFKSGTVDVFAVLILFG